MLDLSNCEELWWSSIARPSAFLKDICEQIGEGNSVLAIITSSFPYRWVFRDVVANEFSTSHSIEYVDLVDELSDYDPGAIVVKHLNSTKLNDYSRCWRDEDRFHILMDLPGMDKAIIWVRSIPEERVNQWIVFLRQYLSSLGHKGIFILELLSDEHVPDRLPQSIRTIDYSKSVSPADLRLFTSMIAASLYPEQEQEYAATLSATVCQTDPEVAALLLEGGDLYKVSVLDKLKLIRDSFEPSSRGFTRGWDNPTHPFSLLDSGDLQQLENRIWTAQLRVAFPIIEMERQSLIAKYVTELRDALSHSYLDRKNDDERWIENETGEIIKDPFDLEIGKLFFMMKVYRYPDGNEYYWEGTTAQDRKRISYLRERRNDLAHLHVVDANDYLPLLYPDLTP